MNDESLHSILWEGNHQASHATERQQIKHGVSWECRSAAEWEWVGPTHVQAAPSTRRKTIQLPVKSGSVLGGVGWEDGRNGLFFLCYFCLFSIPLYTRYANSSFRIFLSLRFSWGRASWIWASGVSWNSELMQELTWFHGAATDS